MTSTRTNRRRPPSNPVPITPSRPSELLQLLELKAWPAFLQRVASHPHEVGSSPCFRNERGYTVLHSLVAYNRGMAGEELARIVEVVLRAAEEIDWGSEYTFSDACVEDMNSDSADVNTNEVEDTQDEHAGHTRTGGAWRLLMDQKNQAQWSPLHLVFVQGGITYGKVPLARALLQMNDAEQGTDEGKLNRRRVLELTDRQNRTMLHHNCTTLGPQEDNFEAAHFLISQCPSLMFERDAQDNTPLEYVLNRLKDPLVTRSGLTLRRDGNDDIKRNFRMLKLLVSGMEREESRMRKAEREEANVNDSPVDAQKHILSTHSAEYIDKVSQHRPEFQEVNATTVEESTSGESESALAAAMRNQPAISPITNNDVIAPQNILNSACRLSKSVCPYDGSLITYLSSSHASELEYGSKSTKKLAEEPDEAGNYALHIFLSNDSYGCNGKDVADKSAFCFTVEHGIVKELIASYPSATSIKNINGILPLRIAMDHGFRNVIRLLVAEYPAAVLLDDRLQSIKLFIEILVCISLSSREQRVEKESEETTTTAAAAAAYNTELFSTMYYLVRMRPDIISLDGLVDDKQQTKEHPKKSLFLLKKMSKLWKR